MVAVQLEEKDYNGAQLAAEIKSRLTSAIAVYYSPSLISVNTVDFDNNVGAINFVITSTLCGFRWNVATLKDLDELDTTPDFSLIMLANRSTHTGNSSDISTYEQYTADQLRIYAPHRDINSQLLNNMGCWQSVL